MSKTQKELKTVKDVMRFVKTLIQFGYNNKDIVNRTNKVTHPDIENSTVEDIVKDVINDYPNYELIQKIVNNKLVIDKDSKDSKMYVVDPKKGIIDDFYKGILNELFIKPDFSSSTYVAKFTYNPYQSNLLYKHGHSWHFNSYTPPKWLEEHFFSGGKQEVKKESSLPILYHDFLMHLVNDDEASFEYVLDWVANSIKNRNYCILTTIGNQGIGKGVLGEIFRELVGNDNFSLTDNRIINKDFNAQLKNKRIIYLDEVLVKTSTEINKFKSLINDLVEVECKGVDAINIKNFASIYTSSNDMDAIDLPADDRRFSIVNLTSKKLKDHFKHDISSLLLTKNIEKLARYLWNRPIDERKMLDVFISKRTEEIRAATLNDWHDYFLNEYCVKYAGRIIKLKEVSSDIEAAMDMSRGPGRLKFDQLAKKYSNKFRVVRPKAVKGKSRAYVIDIAKKQD